MAKRKYQQKQRAEQQEQTRQQILEATMALHEELGPARTTISAIAQRAGVQRLTVYRHFPDDAVLFQSCTSRWLELNPPPQPEVWATEQGPVAKTGKALNALFDYYHQTQNMWRAAYRDVDDVPAMQDPMKSFQAYLDQIRDGLLSEWDAPAPKSLAVTLSHCLRFQTWCSLAEEGLTSKEMCQLAVSWIAAVAGTGHPDL